ncbi:MAG: 4-alpha-glucanotransferase [Pseudomonadota bacterium]
MPLEDTSPAVDADYAALLKGCARLYGDDLRQVNALLSLHGIASEYIEYSGSVAQIPLADRVDILALKGVSLFCGESLDRDTLAAQTLQLTQGPWLSRLPPVAVLSPGGCESVALHFSEADFALQWQWSVDWEDGRQQAQSFSPQDLPEVSAQTLEGQHYSRRLLYLPPFQSGSLPPGYHRLTLRPVAAPALDAQSIPLIVAPSRCYEPAWVLEGQRLWGFSVQLYSLRSERNWGIGDLTDLQELIRRAAGHGASFLVLNPLHALDLHYPDNCSPYSPNDRRRLNLLYIDPAQEEDFTANAALHTGAEAERRQNLQRRLQQREAINYRAVAELKLGVLLPMFQYFLEHHLAVGSARAQRFEQFVVEQGASLQVFAEHEAARWSVASGGIEDPRFTLYTQWLAEMQLEACQRLAAQLGMRIGLVRDLAVGGDGGGAEVVLNKDLFCERASIGAPPDPLAPQGQNWGLPPLDPLQLRHSGYSHFIALLRTNMAHCGALRIDHVMALMRLWWCPRFAGRGTGAYVHYPVDDLFALLRLESVRNRCMVIGEDLGVVPPQVREYLNSSAVFSNVLFYFEKYDGFNFRRPEHYKARALAMVANHDVPTLAAWWNCSDLRLRHQLGLIPTEVALEEQTQWRGVEKRQVLQWLGEQWLLPPQWQGDCTLRPFDTELCAAIMRCCARCSAQLLSVQLEDLALLETPVNIPGTSTEYPNWRRKLPIALSELIDSPTGRALLAGFALERALPEATSAPASNPLAP